ncbi:MAG TPA: ester cyclase [Stackebrandtia sp.]|jgi:steroid delta-isomerase-like uncharacterized protein|uniref:ester cyclase n=1 Tax=Stackebrandtia sp. TaxID=2023065 RepID=UPI002D3CD723|nr:ester cyclase [Stackebrandtia sp.]HZE41058.1 ester cyclase [Stackebrandtia sp.]
MKQTVRRLYEEFLNDGKDAVADEIVTDDFVFHPVPEENILGPARLRHVRDFLATAFSDVRFDVEDMVAEGDRVAVRFTMNATHSQDWHDLPATGKRFAMRGTSFFRVSDGRMAEGWNLLDSAGAMRQLRD